MARYYGGKRRGMRAHMIGKVDRAGRLLDDQDKLIVNKNSAYWFERVFAVRKEIVALVGEERAKEIDDRIGKGSWQRMASQLEDKLAVLRAK